MRPEDQAALVEVVLRPERSRTTVDERLQLMEDKEAVRDLIGRYGFLCDAARWDELLDLYDDGIERVLAGTLDERVKGKEALRPLYESPVLPVRDDTTARVEAKPGGVRGARHLISTEVVRVSDDNTEAWAVASYSLVLTRQDGDDFERGEHEGAYVFTFGKTAAGWKFTRMVVIANSAFNPLNRRVVRQ